MGGGTEGLGRISYSCFYHLNPRVDGTEPQIQRVPQDFDKPRLGGVAKGWQRQPKPHPRAPEPQIFLERIPDHTSGQGLWGSAHPSLSSLR